MTKRKEQRRELLKEDSVLSFLEQVARYIQQNTSQVLIGSVVFLIALGAIFAFQSHSENKTKEDAALLYKADKILNTNIEDETAELKYDSNEAKYTAALTELDGIIASHSGSLRDGAMVRKVSCLIALGRQDELETLYKELTSSKDFAMFGNMGLGDMYMSQSKWDDAVTSYSKLPGDLSELVTYKVARCNKEKGDLETARLDLEKLIAEFDGVEDGTQKPPILNKAQQLLDEIKAETAASEETAS